MAREREPDYDGVLDDEEEEQLVGEAGWVEALQDQFGAVPWWIISAVVHIVIIALMSLIMVSAPQLESTKVAIPMEVAEDPPELEEIVERDVFTADRNVDVANNVEHPVVIHEEVEEFDHMESENNMNNNTARGQEDAISDIPCGGTGVVGNLGVGGGGAGAYGFRGGGGRKRAALAGGGSKKSETAVDRALEWLWRHQESAGHWEGERRFEGDDPGKNTDAGVTGLAVLAFLGAGHTEKTGLEKYQKTVRKAVAWLIKHQDKQGAIGEGFEGGLGYHHAIAGLALAEAYGMAKVPKTGKAAQKAIDYSLNVHQSEYSGWRYKPKTPADVSVTGWFVMQLKSGKIAGLKVDGKGFQGATTFIDKCTKDGGLVSYQPGRSATPTMTAVGLLCRQFMGWKRDNPVLKTGADYLMDSLPDWEGGNVNFYYWYYGTLVMFQMGGQWWKAWNACLRDMLIERQRSGAPKVDGSWDPVGSWCGSGGRVFATASSCLCLEVYYRYLPLYK